MSVAHTNSMQQRSLRIFDNWKCRVCMRRGRRERSGLCASIAFQDYRSLLLVKPKSGGFMDGNEPGSSRSDLLSKRTCPTFGGAIRVRLCTKFILLTFLNPSNALVLSNRCSMLAHFGIDSSQISKLNLSLNYQAAWRHKAGRNVQSTYWQHPIQTRNISQDFVNQFIRLEQIILAIYLQLISALIGGKARSMYRIIAQQPLYYWSKMTIR